jgi:hypothetical protein
MVWPCGSRTEVFGVTYTCAFIVNDYSSSGGWPVTAQQFEENKARLVAEKAAQ